MRPAEPIHGLLVERLAGDAGLSYVRIRTAARGDSWAVVEEPLPPIGSEVFLDGWTADPNHERAGYHFALVYVGGRLRPAEAREPLTPSFYIGGLPLLVNCKGHSNAPKSYVYDCGAFAFYVEEGEGAPDHAVLDKVFEEHFGETRQRQVKRLIAGRPLVVSSVSVTAQREGTGVMFATPAGWRLAFCASRGSVQGVIGCADALDILVARGIAALPRDATLAGRALELPRGCEPAPMLDSYHRSVTCDADGGSLEWSLDGLNPLPGLVDAGWSPRSCTALGDAGTCWESRAEAAQLATVLQDNGYWVKVICAFRGEPSSPPPLCSAVFSLGRAP